MDSVTTPQHREELFELYHVRNRWEYMMPSRSGAQRKHGQSTAAKSWFQTLQQYALDKVYDVPMVRNITVRMTSDMWICASTLFAEDLSDALTAMNSRDALEKGLSLADFYRQPRSDTTDEAKFTEQLSALRTLRVYHMTQFPDRVAWPTQYLG